MIFQSRGKKLINFIAKKVAIQPKIPSFIYLVARTWGFERVFSFLKYFVGEVYRGGYFTEGRLVKIYRANKIIHSLFVIFTSFCVFLSDRYVFSWLKTILLWQCNFCLPIIRWKIDDRLAKRKMLSDYTARCWFQG